MVDAICCSSSCITISGFGNHIAISGCRSVLESLDNAFCELALVENPGIPSELQWYRDAVGDISPSGLDVHIAISGCPSTSHLCTISLCVALSKTSFFSRWNYSNTCLRFIRHYKSVTMTMCSRRWPITTSGFVRHLENVQIPLFILLPRHRTIFSL